jgi:hypothetical protein
MNGGAVRARACGRSVQMEGAVVESKSKSATGASRIGHWLTTLNLSHAALSLHLQAKLGQDTLHTGRNEGRMHGTLAFKLHLHGVTVS